MTDLTKKNKHMTPEDRHEIQMCLDHGMTFKAIAARIGKDQTTVSKEVKKHLGVKEACDVVRTDLAGAPIATPPCPELLKAPFVCNGCKKRRVRCAYQKQLYIAADAQREYKTLPILIPSSYIPKFAQNAERPLAFGITPTEWFRLELVLPKPVRASRSTKSIFTK